MRLDQVAAQLYTVRAHCAKPDDIARSLEKIADIGFTAVQVSGLGPIEDEKLAALCADLGLEICATHENIHDLLDRPEAMIERMQRLGCAHTALGSPGDIALETREQVLDYATRLEASAQKFEAAGFTLSHHNHEFEFRRIGSGTVLDLILENTRAVRFEIDTYWVQFGGANPVTWCRKTAGRMPLLHLKDYAVAPDDRAAVFAEIGAGNLEFEAIIEAAQAGGCQWFIIEQDTTPGDPFESLAQSFEFVRQNLVESTPS